VKTRGKGLLQNVQNILPGSEKASNYCYYQWILDIQQFCCL
jgi:hypothetical protein